MISRSHLSVFPCETCFFTFQVAFQLMRVAIVFSSLTPIIRVIVLDGNGMTLDSIGSSPGHEDGEFESAKLRHPAASFYHAAEDCLYLVDSENHAIRRADMGKRIVETLYPRGAKQIKIAAYGGGYWARFGLEMI